MEKKIEQKTAASVLQQPIEITIGGKPYKVAPPSIATLILASAAVSRLPNFKMEDDKVIEGSLAIAKDCAALGDIMAILILGAKGLKRVVKRTETRHKRYLFGLVDKPYEVTVTEEIDEQANLAKELLNNASPSELFINFATVLRGMEVQDFFALTTFLTEINLLRQTKVE